MLRRRSNASSLLVPLAGAALLTALALWSLPWREGLGRPRTLVERSTARQLGPGYRLLTDAASVLPGRASFVVRTEPPDPIFETWYYRLGVALLPGRRALPPAYDGHFTPPETWREAEYLILIGARPQDPPGDLLLDAPDGTVWRRRKS